MTLRIEKTAGGITTIFRLSGQLVSSQIQSLSEEIESGMPTMALDLTEVTLVDVDTVQFLAGCEAGGIELLNCAPYIREWISRENDRAAPKTSNNDRQSQFGRQRRST